MDLIKIGTILPNGATVLDFKTTPRGGIILAQWQNDSWVTWWFNPGDLKSTCHGHYTHDLADALSDFAARTP
jgi:hypothetical protein